MNLWIFGDSWADPTFGESSDKRWWEILEEEHQIHIEVFGYYGTGPYWSLEEFYKRTHAGIPENTYVIFCISEPWRMNFPEFLQEPHHSREFIAKDGLVYQYADYMKTPENNYVSEFLLDYYFETPEHLAKEYQIASVLKSASYRFSKVIAWQCYTTQWDQHTYLHGQYDYMQRFFSDLKSQLGSSDTFQYIDYALKIIGTKHDEEWEEVNRPIVDKFRNNHMGAKLHRRFAETVYKWITTSGDLDITPLTSITK